MEMNLVTQVQILYEAVCILHNAYTLGKGMNLTIHPLPTWKLILCPILLMGERLSKYKYMFNVLEVLLKEENETFSYTTHGKKYGISILRGCSPWFFFAVNELITVKYKTFFIT